jgi:hypothetical protein
MGIRPAVDRNAAEVRAIDLHDAAPPTGKPLLCSATSDHGMFDASFSGTSPSDAPT